MGYDADEAGVWAEREGADELARGVQPEGGDGEAEEGDVAHGLDLDEARPRVIPHGDSPTTLFRFSRFHRAVLEGRTRAGVGEARRRREGRAVKNLYL